MSETAAARYRIVSVDDHLIEPPDLFEGRMPASLAERAPKVVTLPNGRQVWTYEEGIYPNIGLNAVIGRPKDEWSMDPANFDEMRRGCWDIDARIEDMDLAGIAASVCFPSLIAGFCGAVFARSKDPELGRRACGRGTTGITRCGPAPIPAGSSRRRSPGCAIPMSPLTWCGRTPGGGSGR